MLDYSHIKLFLFWKNNDNIYIHTHNYLHNFFFLNEILSRNNNMTRSKCQNKELAIATVVTRNDLYSTWEEKMANSLCKRGDGREQFTGIKQLLYTPNFQDFSFQSLWEFQTMTKDLWNANNKSTNLNHMFSRFIESFSKNSCILFSLIQIDGRYLAFNHCVFWSLLGTSTRLGKL